MPELYIGIMSGTSLDGIDVGLIEFKDDQIKLLAFEFTPFPDTIKNDIKNLSQVDSPVLLKKLGAIDAQLGSLFASACNKLLENTGFSSSDITAIGSHGQTIHHIPDSPAAFSLQIGDPNIIAQTTGITTIADFRRRDIAAGGQGAPLVPAFHRAIFSQLFDLSKENITIVNIGGIANITYLSADKTTGFDTGPGNALMDFWIQQTLDVAYDKNGNWAKKGKDNQQLIESFKNDPFFKLAPPKSTGKEYFSPQWLAKKTNHFPDCSEKDIQTSLCCLTAETITDAIQQYGPLTTHTLICGGGVHNDHLVSLIKSNLPHPVSSTAEFDINPDHVEAMAFAWLARQSINNLSGNLTEVTGARSPVILGGIYPGKNGLNRK